MPPVCVAEHLAHSTQRLNFIPPESGLEGTIAKKHFPSPAKHLLEVSTAACYDYNLLRSVW